MDRRNFLRLTGAAAAALTVPLPRLGRALAAGDSHW